VPKTYTDEKGCSFVFTHFVLEMENGIDILTGMNMAGIVSRKFLETKGLDFCEKFKKEYTSAQHIPLKMYAIYLSFLSDLFYIASEHGYHFHKNVTTPGELIIYTILNYMNTHYTESLSIKKLATELLSDSTDKISTIVSELGYADQYSFSNAFRKFYDKTPTDFRNQFLH